MKVNIMNRYQVGIMVRQTIMGMGYFIHTLCGAIFEYVVNGRNGIVLKSSWKVYHTEEVVGN